MYEKKGKKTKGEWERKKQKISKIGGGCGKLKNKEKNPNGEEGRKNKKWGFHQMATKFTHTD